MNDEDKIYVDICTKRDLSVDELVDAFRDVGALKTNWQDTQERMVRDVTCSDDPFDVIALFQRTLDELIVVVGGQYKTLQELKIGNRVCALCDCVISESDEYIIVGGEYVCINCADSFPD